MAVTKNLKNRIKNDTFSSVEFEYLDNVGSPIDLTGAAIHIQFRYRCKTGEVVKDISDGSGITITDAAAGKFEIDKFTPITFEVDTYYYDVQTTFANGDIKTYVNGTFKVLQDVTD